MTYDKDLIELIKNKKFKTFWHCLDYLLLVGYKPLDAFSITMKEFGQERIYSDVAFVKFNKIVNQSVNPLIMEINYDSRNSRLFVGLIDETNIHLSGMYDLYRKSIYNGTINQSAIEIEETCEIISVVLTPFIMDYLHTISIKHFGFEAFNNSNNNPIRYEQIGNEYIGGLDVANDIPSAHAFALFRDNLDDNGRPLREYIHRPDRR